MDNSVAISLKLDKNSTISSLFPSNSIKIVTELFLANLARDNSIAISSKFDKNSDEIVPS